MKMTVGGTEVKGLGSFKFPQNRESICSQIKLEEISFSGTFHRDEPISIFEAGQSYKFYMDEDTYYELQCVEILNDGSATFKMIG